MNTYTFSDVLIEPKYSNIESRSNVDISVEIDQNTLLKLPIISANMKTITGPKMANTMSHYGGLGLLHRFNSIENAANDYYDAINSKDNHFEKNIGVSIGVQEEDKKRFDELYKTGARIFCIDVAHGHHILVKNMLQWIKSNNFTNNDNPTLIAGNIATGDAAYDLIEWGADIIKCGIGGGSCCQTRQRTGVGVPQLYALEQCKKIVNQKNKLYQYNKSGNRPIKMIADGGITSVGDISKALKYADFVMLGGFISGTSETPGNVYKDPNGQFYKVYTGSASGENKGNNTFVEGMMKTVPFRGKIKYILREIEDGLRSALSYVGANNLDEFKQKCEFIPITNGGAKESKI
jgi:IMP dehydrogenase